MGIKLISILHKEISPSHCDLQEYGCWYIRGDVSWLSVVSKFLFIVVKLMVNVPPRSQNLGLQFIPGMSLAIQYNSHLTQEEIERQMG